MTAALTAQLAALGAKRWRLLLGWQREAVITALDREHHRLLACARRARDKSLAVPDPRKALYERRAQDHAANAGACRIAKRMLEDIGGHP